MLTRRSPFIRPWGWTACPAVAPPSLWRRRRTALRPLRLGGRGLGPGLGLRRGHASRRAGGGAFGGPSLVRLAPPHAHAGPPRPPRLGQREGGDPGGREGLGQGEEPSRAERAARGWVAAEQRGGGGPVGGPRRPAGTPRRPSANQLFWSEPSAAAAPLRPATETAAAEPRPPRPASAPTRPK